MDPLLERKKFKSRPRAKSWPALLTLAGSLAVSVLLTAANERALLSRKVIAADAALKLGGVVLAAGLVWISWRLVGRHPSSPTFLVACSYLLGAWLLIFSLLTALDSGAMRLFEPKLFAEIIVSGASGQDTQRLKALVGSEGTYALKVLLNTDRDLADSIRTPGFLWIASMAAVRGVFTFAWLVVSWAVLRKLLRASWLSAVLSFAIFLLVGLMAALAVGFFQMAPIVVDPGRWIPTS